MSWTVVSSDGSDPHVCVMTKRGEVQICNLMRTPKRFENAFLIAAAPDMFRILKHLISKKNLDINSKELLKIKTVIEFAEGNGPSKH